MNFILPALLLRIFSNPLANLIQKKLSLDNSPLIVNFYSSFFLAVFSLPLVFCLDFSKFTFSFYLYVLLSGFLCFSGTICLIKALSLGEMSVLGPINSYKSVIGLLFGLLFLREIPSLKAASGFFIIIFASFFFTDKSGRFFLNKSVLLRFLALAFTGIEAVIIKKIIILSNPVDAFFFWCQSGFIFSFLTVLLSGKITANSLKISPFAAMIAVLLFIMQLSTNYVFKYCDVGLSLALFQLSNIVSLILGFKFFREDKILKKSIGTILMLFGSLLILL